MIAQVIHMLIFAKLASRKLIMKDIDLVYFLTMLNGDNFIVDVETINL